MCAYSTKNSDRQIKNSPIPTESQFAKFNARQIFPLYGIQHRFMQLVSDSCTCTCTCTVVSLYKTSKCSFFYLKIDGGWLWVVVGSDGCLVLQGWRLGTPTRDRICMQMDWSCKEWLCVISQITYSCTCTCRLHNCICSCSWYDLCTFCIQMYMYISATVKAIDERFPVLLSPTTTMWDYRLAALHYYLQLHVHCTHTCTCIYIYWLCMHACIP